MTTLPETRSDVRQFERTCVYCGARFAVTVPREGSATAVLRDYHCPECGKGSEVRSLLPPLVRLVAPRTDGKSDAYQETIF
jgi:DNA-directed RNA polymerase subunit RPC12/RpoP